MKFNLLQVVVVAVAMSFFLQPAAAQEDEIYDFDGVADMDPQPEDPTDWMTSVNWSDGGFDPLPPFGPAIPDFGTRVEIRTSTFGVDAPEIGPGDEAEAFGVRIGREEGPGLLTMTGGTLETANSCTMSPFTCNRRLRVGASDSEIARHPGTFNLIDGQVTTDNLWIGSGSHGEMNMSGGVVNTRENLYFDWTYDASSVLNMTGGTINVGGLMRMFRTSELNLDGGQILVAGPAELGTQNNVDRANCKLGFDAWSPALRGEELYEAAKKMAPHTVMTTNADYVRLPRFRYRPECINYERTQPDLVRAVKFGTGFVDYAAFFRGLKEGGFDGVANYEMCSPIRGGGSLENLDAYSLQYVDWMRANTLDVRR